MLNYILAMFFKLYLITLVNFLLLDGLWLGLIAKNFYQKNLGGLMTSTPNWLAAGIFYLIFTFGLVYFVLYPSLSTKETVGLLTKAAIFGLVTYATYDLTNLATLKNWPLMVTIVDLAWGTLLSSAVALVTHFIATKIGLS